MKRLIILAAPVLLIAGCSKSDEQVIADSCVENGNERPFCTCLGEKIAETLSPELTTKIADGLRAGAESPEVVIQDLPAAEQVQTLQLIPKILECG